MPLLRITCPPAHTERVVALLREHGEPRELAVLPAASRLSGGDLVLADVPRHVVDGVLELLPAAPALDGLHVAVEASEVLYPPPPDEEEDDEDAVIWAQVTQDIHDTGRLCWLNTLLVVIAAAIAAVGILADQLLLIVGAMALSPDYYPVADCSLATVQGDGRRAGRAAGTLVVVFAAGAAGAWALAALLRALDVVGPSMPGERAFTEFIAKPDVLSLVVALLAGVAGALAITLPDARGLVGVFVSITTIPAAANVGVGLAEGDTGVMGGAALQLGVNVASLLAAGIATLAVRRHLGRRLAQRLRARHDAHR